MRTSEGGTNLTARNQHIRMFIAKTLLSLMNEKQLDEITITELVKQAHVSRMTFYKYYKTKQEVLNDYMFEIVNDYMEDIKNQPDIGGFHDYKHICHCFTFFQKSAPFIKILLNANLYSVIINALNEYMDQYVFPTSKRTKYDLYYYAGALCNTYIKWIESDMKETPEEIAMIVYRHLQI